jgi:hypothetical protein
MSALSVRTFRLAVSSDITFKGFTGDFIPGQFIRRAVIQSAAFTGADGLDSVRISDAHPFFRGLRALRTPQSWSGGENSGGGPRKRRGAGDGWFVILGGAAHEVRAKRSASRDAGGRLSSCFSAGGEWAFRASAGSDEALDAAAKLISGLQELGGGAVSVSEVSVKADSAPASPAADGILRLYAEGRLAFLSPGGLIHAAPGPEDLCLPAGSKILWERSAVKTSLGSAGAPGIFIEKGSVIAVDISGAPDFNIDSYSGAVSAGAGILTGGGFGGLIVNPRFLDASLKDAAPEPPAEPVKQDSGAAPAAKKAPPAPKDKTAAWAEARAARLSFESAAAEAVKEALARHAADFAGISAPHWAAVRAVIRASSGFDKMFYNLFAEEGVKSPERSGKERRSGLTEGLLNRPVSTRGWGGRAKILATAMLDFKRRSGPAAALLAAELLCSAMIRKSVETESVCLTQSEQQE